MHKSVFLCKTALKHLKNKVLLYIMSSLEKIVGFSFFRITDFFLVKHAAEPQLMEDYK